MDNSLSLEEIRHRIVSSEDNIEVATEDLPGVCRVRRSLNWPTDHADSKTLAPGFAPSRQGRREPPHGPLRQRTNIDDEQPQQQGWPFAGVGASAYRQAAEIG